MLLFGRDGVASNRNSALELVKEGVRLACHHCQGVLAYCLWEDGDKDSRELAFASSRKGSKYGQIALGAHHDDDNDDVEALVLFRLAAEQNLDTAQLWLGKIVYEGGRCPEENYAEALRWFMLAADQGYPDALFFVGHMHEHGHGVRAEKAEAIHWYRLAASAGHTRAVYMLQTLGG